MSAWTCSQCGIQYAPNGRVAPGRKVYGWERRPTAHFICPSCSAAKKAETCRVCGLPKERWELSADIDLGSFVCSECIYAYSPA